jgi:parallel beta-helix repeat protein
MAMLGRPLLVSLALLAPSGWGAGGDDAAAPSPAPGASPVAAAAIGEWQDSGGACPTGAPVVELSSRSEIEDASRGEGRFSGDAPETCYLIRNGTYRQGSQLLLYVQRGGSAAAPRRFVGESRSGVVLVGRATVGDGVSHVVISNLTFTLAGYSQPGTYNTVTLGNGADLTLDHVTITGDCATGSRGGHVEVDGTRGVLVDSCLIEKFGHCGAGGHEDHGIYLAFGSDITIRNNVIRGNSSRGIQLYTGNGSFGTLSRVKIERNRIHSNGHASYEDGIVVNGRNDGTISELQISRNLIYGNFYSGIRFAGPSTTGVRVERNTFYHNGAGSSSGERSEINIDDVGGAARSSLMRNLFGVGFALINDCYDGAKLAFELQDNAADAPAPGGARGNCVSTLVRLDPQFADPARGDFHPLDPAAAAYGAYAP